MGDLELLKYPIGRFAMPSKIADEDVQEYIRIIGNLPTEIAKTIENFDDEKFDTPYRENGWTVRQVIIHIAEAHSRAYASFTQALKENNLAGSHNENETANVNNNQTSELQTALDTIYDLHERWFSDLKSFSAHEFNLTFFYQGAGGRLSFAQFLAIFAWHGKHHLAHIKNLKERNGKK